MSDNLSSGSACCCSMQFCQKCIKMEQANNSFKEENSELKSELEQLRKKTERLTIFVLIPNKITDVDNTATCCRFKCINKNLKYGYCIYYYGFVNVRKDGTIKYYLADKKENNKFIIVYAQNSFKRTDCYSQRYSLFYFEVKMIKETDNESYASIGLRDVAELFLCNSTCSYGNQKFSWKDEDVFGCGVVFQPYKNTHTIVFFTKNGNKIGNKIFLEEIKELYPIIGLKACSVETNFGYDLETKPFIYDVNKHFFELFLIF